MDPHHQLLCFSHHPVWPDCETPLSPTPQFILDSGMAAKRIFVVVVVLSFEWNTQLMYYKTHCIYGGFIKLHWSLAVFRGIRNKKVGVSVEWCFVTAHAWMWPRMFLSCFAQRVHVQLWSRSRNEHRFCYRDSCCLSYFLHLLAVSLLNSTYILIGYEK